MSVLTFAREFLSNAGTVGAVLPSSRALAHRMVEAANVPHARRVLELGAGTGAFTAVIRDVMPASAQFLGVEMNEVFVGNLRERFPALDFIAAPAQDVNFNAHLPADCGFDSIVSGLPWTAFPEALQLAILGHVLPKLAPGGCFATFAYYGFHLLPRGRHFRALLERQPGRLHTTSVVWGNVPPAFVYVLRREGGA